jgi:hypothetical protein
MLFEYQDSNNIKKLNEYKTVVLNHTLLTENISTKTDSVIDEFKKQDKSDRLLIYKLVIDKFNQKYSNLSESQKRLLNQYITHINDTESLREYIKKEIPTIKKQLSEHANKITDQVTQIKVQKLSELLCSVENIKTIKESHILSILRYFELVDELIRVHR